MLAENPTVVSGHAFTTGKIARRSIERVLPNTQVNSRSRTGSAATPATTRPAELQGKVVPDEHLHEHATCFNMRGKGLIVISSCGHAGIVNSVRQAQEVSGIQKVHAIVGGFHLGPAPADYLKKSSPRSRSSSPMCVIPMHCSGENFVREVQAQMPDNVLVSTTGSQFTFAA